MTRRLTDEAIKVHYDKLIEELTKELGAERKQLMYTLVEYALVRVLNAKIDKFIEKYLDLGTEDLYQFYKFLPKAPAEVDKCQTSQNKKAMKHKG